MKFTFKDVDNKELYDTGLVVFITGPYNIFNNMVVDGLKKKADASAISEISKGLTDEFGIQNEDGDGIIKVSNSVDFNTFLDVVNIPSMEGKWFCRVDLRILTKKQKNRLDNYIGNPNPNGILVVVSNDYKDFRSYLGNRVLGYGKVSHIIQLSFPSRTPLVRIVRRMFEDKGVKMDVRTAQLFVMRMSRAYDDYSLMVDKICTEYKGCTISYNQIKDELKGVNNYILEDFIERLLRPIKSDKIDTRRDIYKMYGSLLSEMGAVKLVNSIKYRLEDYIELRLAINKGIIPIKVRYSVIEAKERLGIGNRLHKIPDFKFRRMAYIASLTSMRDWMFMKMILNNIKYKFDEEENEKVLYSLIHRAVLTEGRLSNDIGMENVLEKKVEKIDSIRIS